MKRILFQGDSITDTNRFVDEIEKKGMGYPLLVSARLGYECTGKYEFINRGISGNRIRDVYGRIDEDILELKPDFMSLLVGVNDASHELKNGNVDDLEEFKKTYEALLIKVKTTLPDIKIMILEPFVLKGYETDFNWSLYRGEVEKHAECVKEISKKFEIPFVSLQAEFDNKAKNSSAEMWLRDGIHPTPAGHELIARSWLETFNSYILR